jgi:HD-like signal output (HDOD) protein
MVLAEWSLPDSICTAVRLSHDNTVESTNEANHMAMVINASDRVGKLLCEIPDVTQSADECVAAMQFVGAELAVLEKVLGRVEADVEELAGMLKIDVIPSAVYAKIAEAIRERLAVGAG